MAATATAPARPTAHRAELRTHVRPHEGPTTSINVGDAERWASTLGGTALGIFGLTRGSLGGLALAAIGGSLLYRGLGGHCHLYGALGINTAGPRGPATSVAAGHGVRIDESVTIQKPAAELFRFWRNLENLGRFMDHLQEVHTQGDRSHWVACGPMGTRVEWDAEIITERPNELIGWRSLPGSEIDTAGSVHFRELPGRGTEVRVELKYDPPAGKMGHMLARLFGRSPQEQIREDLRRFKQYMETGEVPTTAGQSRGTCH